MRGAQCILVHYLNILLQFCKFPHRTAHCVATELHHCSLHCTALHNAHQSAKYTAHCTRCIAQCAAQCKVHCTLHTLYTLHIEHIVHCTVYTAHCTVQSAMHPITVQKVSLHMCAAHCLPAASIFELHIVQWSIKHCTLQKIPLEY